MPTLAAGKKAPDFKAQNTNGDTVQLKDLLGPKGLILYFYPRDMTPGCTVEACDFRDNNKQIEKMGFHIAGVSKDSAKSHVKFTEKENLTFPLIADEDKSICQKYNVWQEKTFMGKKSLGILRTTFIIGSDLKILKVYDNVKTKGHVEAIIKDIKGMGL
jgi:peroxiredoxin Q/BCP